MPRQTTKYSKPHLQSVIRLLEKRFVSNKKVFKEKKSEIKVIISMLNV